MEKYKVGGLVLYLSGMILLVVSRFPPYNLAMLCTGILFLVAGAAVIAWLHGKLEKKQSVESAARVEKPKTRFGGVLEGEKEIPHKMKEGGE